VDIIGRVAHLQLGRVTQHLADARTLEVEPGRLDGVRRLDGAALFRGRRSRRR
jgi:hypothetical protein